MHDETQDILRNKLTKEFAAQGISEQVIHKRCCIKITSIT
ncbi:hypothetical protein PUN28_020859 [Cardiocondyla obscurior]|uniref:Uncharacterized protein n=1 Tax=Cardiocondyla obscurior TaxID=286306 RepID=A0AAW2EAP8_9HYME